MYESPNKIAFLTSSTWVGQSKELLPAVSGVAYRIRNVQIAAATKATATMMECQLDATAPTQQSATLASICTTPGALGAQNLNVTMDFITKPGTNVQALAIDGTPAVMTPNAANEWFKIVVLYTEITD